MRGLRDNSWGVALLDTKVILLSLGQGCPCLFRIIAAEGQAGPSLWAIILEQICSRVEGSFVPEASLRPL